MMPECPHCRTLKVERNGFCATSNAEHRKSERQSLKDANKVKKPISQVSKKQSAKVSKYNKRVAKWKIGKVCAVKKCSANCDDNHHSMGTIGYADEWARENDITLQNDERFWVPLCRFHHIKATNDSVWAWENEISFKRVTDPVFRKPPFKNITNMVNLIFGFLTALAVVFVIIVLHYRDGGYNK